MTNRWLPISLMASLAVAALTACGCVSTKTTRVARFEPAAAVDRVDRPAPKAAAYKVKFADESGEGLRTLGGTKRIVGRGERLVFATSPDGTVIAVAGDERIVLDRLPESVRYCVWTCSEKRRTQFSREVEKAASVAGAAALLVGLGVADVMIEAALDKAIDTDDRDRDHRRRRRRGCRWVGAEGAPQPQPHPQPQKK